MRVKMYPEFATRFTSQEHLYNYLYGGAGIVTLDSPSGESHTYSYEKPQNSAQFPEDTRFVYAIHTGINDNGEIFHTKYYVGMIENDQFRCTRSSRFREHTPIVKGAFYIEKLRKSQAKLDSSPMKIYHQGVCGLCGSKIWSTKSRECGFGRNCRKHVTLPDFGYPHV